jgi:two-component system chemotaxis response regulator CheB
MTKLLIVDDSALMRRQLSEVFSAEGDFEVKFARNGEEAVAANLEFEPDVMTLDINMPEMDGLSALSRIMVERPLPVVMVSSLTEQGALATFEALNLGAVDYIPKPGGTISLSIGSIRDQLVAKVRAAARARVRGRGTAQGLVQKIREQRRQVEAARPEVVRRVGGRDGMVLIGVSTGGPRTLEEMLPRLPAEFPGRCS